LNVCVFVDVSDESLKASSVASQAIDEEFQDFVLIGTSLLSLLTDVFEHQSDELNLWKWITKNDIFLWKFKNSLDNFLQVQEVKLQRLEIQSDLSRIFWDRWTQEDEASNKNKLLTW